MLSSLYSDLSFRVSKVVESNFVSAGLLKLDRSGLAGIHISIQLAWVEKLKSLKPTLGN